MYIKLSLFTLLLAAQGITAHENLCKDCPKPCAQVLEELKDYENKKEILFDVKRKKELSKDDLKELLEVAKENNDFETHAEAYHRWKLEVATEDEGSTVVIKIKQMGVPVTLAALAGGGIAYFLKVKNLI
jgi:pyruvate-formate lyase-activating enzyme